MLYILLFFVWSQSENRRMEHGAVDCSINARLWDFLELRSQIKIWKCSMIDLGFETRMQLVSKLDLWANCMKSGRQSWYCSRSETRSGKPFPRCRSEKNQCELEANRISKLFVCSCSRTLDFDDWKLQLLYLGNTNGYEWLRAIRNFCEFAKKQWNSTLNECLVQKLPILWPRDLA